MEFNSTVNQIDVFDAALRRLVRSATRAPQARNHVIMRLPASKQAGISSLEGMIGFAHSSTSAHVVSLSNCCQCTFDRTDRIAGHRRIVGVPSAGRANNLLSVMATHMATRSAPWNSPAAHSPRGDSERTLASGASASGASASHT